MTDYSGIALVITASASFVGAAAAIVATVYNGRRIGQVHTTVQAIDQAVNSKPAGETSISQDVSVIRSKQEHDRPTRKPAKRQR